MSTITIAGDGQFPVMRLFFHVWVLVFMVVKQNRPRTALMTPSGRVADEPCSTTRLAGDSLLCPHGYVCRVTYRGDRRKGIPNRGKCVPQKQRRRKGRLFHPRTPGGAAADYVSTWSFLPLA